MIRLLSLGAGVQSTCVLLMSCEGELSKLDHAVFADTGWEPAAVYRHLDWLQRHAEEHGVKVHRIQKGNVKEDALRYQRTGEEGRFGSVPLFVLQENGERGMVRRTCTREYKVDPLDRYIRREILGLRPKARAPKEHIIDQWFGISLDEFQRTRSTEDPWRRFVYPLVELRMTREDCERWMDEHGYPKAPRSACVGCPFHTDAEWRRLRDESPEEFAEAVAFDEAMRRPEGLRGEAFIHSSRRPLRNVDFRSDAEKGQGFLFAEECEGMCGV